MNRLVQTVIDNLLAWYVIFTVVGAMITWAVIVQYGRGTFRFWEWTAQSWQAVATFAALTGVVGIFFQVHQNAERQRKETSPYVRVDIGPTEEDTATSSIRPEAHIVLGKDYFNVGDNDSATPPVSISAWFQNYQTHPLGMCFSVSAGFNYEARGPLGEVIIIEVESWEIAYLEHGKPVQIELFRLPRCWSISVELVYLEYQDFYALKHLFFGNYSSGIHGRLECSYNLIDGFESTPRAIPRRR